MWDQSVWQEQYVLISVTSYLDITEEREADPLARLKYMQTNSRNQ